MKAKLITLCQCSREFEVTCPPPPRIDIELRPEGKETGWLNMPPDYTGDPRLKIRSFELDLTTGKTPIRTAVYVECNVY